MAKRKKKTDIGAVEGILLGYVSVLDAVFTRATGKNIKGWLEEFRRQPRELPPSSAPAPQEPDMALDWAYAILGLPKDAPIDEVKSRYRVLAKLYHPDMPGGYDEAFKILDRAYKRVMKEKRK